MRLRLFFHHRTCWLGCSRQAHWSGAELLCCSLYVMLLLSQEKEIERRDGKEPLPTRHLAQAHGLLVSVLGNGRSRDETPLKLL